MAGITMSVRVLDGEFRRVLHEVMRRGLDPRPLLKVFATYLRGRTVDRFRDSRGPGGMKWTPLAEATRRARSRRSPSRRFMGAPRQFTPLWDSGRLVSSLSTASAASIQRRGLEYGTNVLYAAIHQLGGMAGRGRSVRIPARPFLYVEREDEEEFARLGEEYLGRDL